MLIKEEGYKVNFIDSNDVFVGYDVMQDCCESAGYFISYDKDEPFVFEGCGVSFKEMDLDGYNFDTTYFAHVYSQDLDAGDQVCFKLISDGKEDLYLHLFNSQNGWYSHGFIACISDIEWESGSL